ncbi:MAG: V-type ATP synthase subunit B, partial [Kiritimatiellia bacterium]
MRKVYQKIEQIAGNVIVVRAEGVGYRELAEVKSAFGTSLAQVIRLDGEQVYLQVFAGSRGISTESEVRFLGRTMQVPFSDALLGRVFTGSGSPRDRGPGITENMTPIGGPSANPA